MKSKSLNLLLLALFIIAPIQACQKPSVTGQSQTGGGGGSGGETVEKVDFELIGSVSEEDPGDLGNSSSSEVSGSLNLSAGSGYQIAVLSISPDGQKTLEHESVSASRSFKLNFQVPKRYLALEVLRRADNRKFKAILPPPTTAKTASVNFDKTSTIAGVILDKVGSNAASGNQAALEALANQSVSVADIMKIAQSVRRTIDEQKSPGVASAIDISPVASSITTKSNERLASLQSGDLSASSLASKISDATYTDLFGRGAEIIPPGVLAHLVDHKLGSAAAATKDVAYEAIKGSTTLPMKQVQEAFKAEADAFRAASNLSDALAAEQQVATNFASRFNVCIQSTESCAATAYVPPVPPSIVASIPSDNAIDLPDALAPASSVLAGSYMTAQAVTITSGTSGATIYYTTDGSSPSASSSVYSTPILVQVSQTIKAIAVKSGYQNSSEGTFGYTITGTVQAPSFSVPAAGYGPAQSVTLSSATPGATIYYTTDGSTPSSSSSFYAGAITVSSSQTLKAFAVLDGWADSQVSSAQYTINGQVDAPSLSIASGTYTSQQSLTLSTATSGALLYYTTNGNTPSASSTLYSGAISVGSSMTIKVIAVKSGYSNSNVSMGEYTLNIPLPLAATPSASQAAGTYTTSKTVTLTSATAGATIYYTSNDSVPTTSSTVYSAPILVQVTQTIKAIAVKAGYQNSSVGTFAYTITGTVQSPTFSVAAGGYGPAQSVILSSATPGASIYYTTNGDTPSRSSSLYSGAITVSSSQTLKAFAVLDGWADSQVSSAQYTINGQASAPTFSLAASTYTSAQSVTLSSTTADALIYYTTNGDTPSASSTLYSGAISVGSSMTIKAIAIKAAFSNSSVSEAEYTINIPLPIAEAPAASPAAGTYTSAQSVSLSSGTSGATIYYTTDDSLPSTSSMVYSSPFLVQVSQTIKAIAVKSGYQNSGEGTFGYTITGTVQAPSFSVATGGYGPAQSVTLSSATPGASIYYTTNGDTPSRSSNLYLGAITVSASQTVKAFAVLEDWADSSDSSAQYTINGQASAPTFGLAAGTYTSVQSVTLSSTTADALIYYTVNGDTPSSSSTLYSGAISVGSSMTIKAIAIKAAFSNSSVSEAEYTINIPLPIAEAPAASPAAGTYTSAQSVSLSSGTSGATIYYTTDDSPPSTSSMVYSSPLLVQVSQTIKAIAVKSGYQNSGVGTFSYTITGTVQSPSFSVPAAGYGPAQSVTLSSATPGASIYYTTNGDTPSRSSSLYSGAITVSASQTIKAFAVLEDWADSSVSSAEYTINGQASAPTFSVTSGTYTSVQSVTLASATADALIYYTVNGDTPSSSSTLYSGAISVGSSMTIKAIAIKADYSSSSIVEVTYTINISEGPSISVSALIVAGGGGGGVGGGGGAGGLLYYGDETPRANSSLELGMDKTYSVAVGAGGVGLSGGDVASPINGGNSSITGYGLNIIAYGGGAGATASSSNSGGIYSTDGYTSYLGAVGGSGGGSGGNSHGTGRFVAGGQGTPMQGHKGGDLAAEYGCSPSAGGGGAGGPAATVYGSPTAGGSGLQYSISGSEKYYAGGGGGGSYCAGGASGGVGGGGNGSPHDQSPTSGVDGTGGGGGGVANAAQTGGRGGSGVIIIRYPDSYPLAEVSGAVDYKVADSYRIYEIRSDSTFKIPSVPSSIKPSAPLGLAAVPSDSKMTLSWSAPSYPPAPVVTDYLIEFSSDGGSNWTAFEHPQSPATSIEVTGLTNDMQYKFRVAGVSTSGAGSFTNIITATPAIIPVISILQQPMNNFSMTYNDSIQMTINAQISADGNLNYKWQYWGMDWNYYQEGWFDVPDGNSSTISVSPSSTGNYPNVHYYSSEMKFRCILSGDRGASTVTSSEVRWLNYTMIYPYAYSYPDYSWSSGSEVIDGNYYDVFNLQVGESLYFNYYDYGMGYGSFDSSWYSSNAFTVKIQESTDSITWTDVENTNHRGSGFWGNKTFSPIPGATRYYRAMLYFNWPLTTTNGTQSAERVTTPRFMGGVKVAWPAPPE